MRKKVRTASDPVSDLGLMGGMFDPVHLGHLTIAEQSCDYLQLQAMILLPCGQPVHGKQLMASAAHRLAMLELATRDNSMLTVDDRECRLDGPSYTYNSLQAIKSELPQSRLYYVMGQDAFNQFHTWYCWRNILSLTHIVVVARPGYRPEAGYELKQEIENRMVTSTVMLKQANAGNILIAELELLNISSTMIREKLSRQEPVADFIPGQILEYIKQHNLYNPEKKS